MRNQPNIDHDSATHGRHGTVWDWLGAFSGLAFIVLLVAGVMIGDPNSGDRDANPDQPGSAIAQLFAERRDDAQLGATINVVAIFCFIAFIAYLYPMLRERGDDWTATIALGGGLVAAGFLVFMVNIGLATAMEDFGEEPAVARTLAAMTWDSVLVLGAPLAAFVAGISTSALRHAVLPRWIGWAGLPIAALMLTMPVAYLGFMLFVPWMMLVSLAVLWQVWSARAVAGASTSPIPQPS